MRRTCHKEVFLRQMSKAAQVKPFLFKCQRDHFNFRCHRLHGQSHVPVQRRQSVFKGTCLQDLGPHMFPGLKKIVKQSKLNMDRCKTKTVEMGALSGTMPGTSFAIRILGKSGAIQISYSF